MNVSLCQPSYSYCPSPREFSVACVWIQAIFANNYDGRGECERCEQTVAPLAAALGIQIDHASPTAQPRPALIGAHSPRSD